MSKLFRSLFVAGAAWSLASSVLAGPFMPGNLAVYRVGTGTGAVTDAGTAVFIDEYTPTGTLVQSIPMPTVDPDGAGAQRRLTAQGTATLEGLINLSSDGQYLLVPGYDAAVGSATPASANPQTVNRVVGRVDALGNVDTSTVLSLPATATGSIRSAMSTNGTDIWATSGTATGGGVHYTTFGSTSSTQLSTANVNLRQVDIFDGQLYITTMSGSTVRVGTVGAGTPTTGGQSIATLPGVPTTGSPDPDPVQIFMADLSLSVMGIDTLYVADNRSQGSNGGLYKYSLQSNGQWTSSGSIAGVQTPPVSVMRGLTGVVDVSGVTLYATRNTNQLLKFLDTSGHNGTISGAFTVFATAATNTQFKGLDFVATAIPEAGSWLLVGGVGSLVGLVVQRRRRSGR